MINQNLKPIDMIFRVQSISLFMYTVQMKDFFAKISSKKKKKKGKKISSFFIGKPLSINFFLHILISLLF